MSLEQTSLATATHDVPTQQAGVTYRAELINGTVVTLGETSDFPRSDPWSIHTRNVIARVAEEGNFVGRTVLEAGAGDGRNREAMGPSVGIYVGVDVDSWRLDVARHNFREFGVPEDQFVLEASHVVPWLDQRAKQIYGGPVHGWGIACLPQAPSGEHTASHADGYNPADNFLGQADAIQLYGLPADAYGLKLNAAFLGALRDNVSTDFNLLITLSDRVPRDVLQALFERTGWKDVAQFQTPFPIQQDPDTSVKYVETVDDGQRFFRADGSLLSAREAEAMRLASVADGTNAEAARETLDVFHHVSVFQLQPRYRTDI